MSATGAALALDVPTPSVPVAAGTEDGATSARQWAALRITGAVVMAGWMIGLVVFSTILYHRYDLTADFGAYNQAWSLIGEGHLNPFSTLYVGYPFVKSDFELILWPLALIHVVFPRPVVLLWLQDAAVAGTGLVVYLWIIDVLERRKVNWRLAAGIGVVVLVAVIANPGVYQTLLYDIHMEPFSTLFLVLAGRDLWRGKHRRVWIWVPIALLCGSFAAVTVVGLGVSALLAGPSTRRAGLTLVVVALAWLGVISVIGANAGSGIDNYAYLAGRTSVAGSAGIAVIGWGVITHPNRAWDEIYGRLHYLFVLIRPAGLVGLASAWGFGVPAVVMTTNVLNSQYEFIYQAFQNTAVFPFLLLGTVMVLVWVAQRFRYGWIPSVLVAAVVTIQALTYGYSTSPGNIRWAVAQIQPGPAHQIGLALDQTPADAEVITTIAIIGRFSARPSVYWFAPTRTVPIQSRHVVFVLDPANENTIPNANSADDAAAVTYLGSHLHGRVLVNADGIWAFEWQPPPGTTHFTFPATPPA